MKKILVILMGLLLTISCVTLDQNLTDEEKEQLNNVPRHPNINEPMR